MASLSSASAGAGASSSSDRYPEVPKELVEIFTKGVKCDPDFQRILRGNNLTELQAKVSRIGSRHFYNEDDNTKLFSFFAAICREKYTTSIDDDTFVKLFNKYINIDGFFKHDRSIGKTFTQSFGDNFLQFLRKEICREKLKAELQFRVEDDIFDKFFDEFVTQRSITFQRPSIEIPFTQDYKEDFLQPFIHRQSSMPKVIKREFDEIIEKDLKKENDPFIRDAARTGTIGSFGTIEIEGGKLKYEVKKFSELSDAEITRIEQAKVDEESIRLGDSVHKTAQEKWSKDLETKKAELKRYLTEKGIDPRYFDQYVQFILYMFSQVAEVTCFSPLIYGELFGSETTQFFQIVFEKKDLDFAIEIVDKKVKLTIRAKREDQLFSYQTQPGNSPTSPIIDGVYRVKNPQTTWEFQFNEGTQKWETLSGDVDFHLLAPTTR